MSVTPQLCVVMGVRNGASALRETLDSVLTQLGVDLEFVVVDDGSDDETPAILCDYAARDPRLRILRQAKLGLTRALIAGCEAARAPVIARQDCDDVSLPGRFAQQLAKLAATPGAALVSTSTEYVGPRGEALYSMKDTDERLQARLADMSDPRGPSCHGAALFTVDAYGKAGGYRAAFPVAQDLDLWMRLYETGPCVAVPCILYRARLSPSGVSATRRAHQLAFKQIIAEGAAARRSGRPDMSVEAAQRLRLPPPVAAPGAFAYFLGRVLEARDPGAARGYLTQAVRERPFFPRAWIALARASARDWRRVLSA
jgi:glycosyltransferase involved in cell wall biosynthesis